MPHVQIEVDVTHLRSEMDRLGGDLPRAAMFAMNKTAGKLVSLMKRNPPCPVRTGALRSSIRPDEISTERVIVGPHKEYAERMNAMYGFVDEAMIDLQPQIVGIFDEAFRGWGR